MVALQMNLNHEHVQELTLDLALDTEPVIFQLPKGERRVMIHLLNVSIDDDGHWIARVRVGSGRREAING